FLARQWPSPAAIAVTPVRFFTCTGTDELVVVPLPSSPSVFIPQPQTVPSDLSATVCPPAAAIAVTPVRPCTCTGTDELVVVPLPSSPSELQPQSPPVPSFNSTTLLP